MSDKAMASGVLIGFWRDSICPLGATIGSDALMPVIGSD
jgi:hypothetical protein